MFLNPLMLAGLGGAVLPLVLHLLARSRFRTVDWAAMMFLQAADPRERQSTRLRQFLLLLLRMVLVSLLAVALARPLVSDSFAAVASGGHLSTVVIVDASLSTSVVENGKPRSEFIRQSAIQVVTSMQKGDEVALIIAGLPGHSTQWTTDLTHVADDIASLRPAGRANMAEALVRASDLLNRSESQNRRIVIVTDRQAVSWREVDVAFRSAWRSRSRPGAALPITVAPVGNTSADNLAMASVSVLNPPVVRDQPIEIEARIRNYGNVRRAGVVVSVGIGGREITRATVDCPPDSNVPLRLSARLNEPGPAVLNAAIQMPTPIGIASDDAMDLSLDVADATKVLLISGDERAPKSSAESFFANAALQPAAAAGKPGFDPFKVTTIRTATVTPADLQSAQVAVLANVDSLSPAMATALEQFIYDGGGLLVAPGSLTRVDDYNDRLYRDGAGFLPARLTLPADAGQVIGIGQVDLAHPTIQFLRGRSELPAASIGKWFRLSPRSDARIIASLSTGDVFAVESTVGRGRVMMFATPLDADWSTLPLTSFYLPFLQSSSRWLAGGGADRNLSPGTPIVYSWTGSETRTASLLTPDGRTIALDPQRQGERAEVRYGQTHSPGVYRLRVSNSGKRDTIVPYVVGNPSDESDLTPLTKNAWSELQRDMQLQVIEPTGQSIADLLAAKRAGHEIWGLLILAVIACALLETWLSGRWSSEV